ncbi:MAG: tetratricopeptide repeat protein, partial [Myxococcales bacterium]|nr:tetratricopeptide repeat protein [Myxococcales bacterium]
QSEARLDLRMGCLDQRLAELDALVGALTDAPDRDAVEHAVDAVAQLPPLTRCDDVEALADAYPRPADPTRRAALDDLERRVRDAEAAIDLGQMARGRDLVTPLVDEVRRADFPPLLARVLHDQVLVLRLDGATDQAEAALREAIQASATAHDDARSLDLWNAMLVVLSDAGREDEALATFDTVRAALARAGDHPLDRARVLTNEALVLERRAAYADAVARLEEATALQRDANAPAGDLALTLMSLGRMRSATGDLDGGAAALTEALALDEATLGADHPRTIAVLGALAGNLRTRGDLAGARDMLADAVARSEAANGADSEITAEVRGRLGGVRFELGDLAGGVAAYERATAAYATSHNAVGRHAIWHNYCTYMLDLAEPADSEQVCRHALDAAHALGEHHPYIALETVQLGDVLMAQDRAAEAEPQYRAALAEVEATLGPDHIFAVLAHNGLGLAALALGRPAETVAEIDRVLATLERTGSPDPRFIPQARFTGAQARWALGAKARARREAIDAAAALRDVGASTA